MRKRFDTSLLVVALAALILALSPGHLSAAPQQMPADVTIYANADCDQETRAQCTDMLARRMAEMHARAADLQARYSERWAREQAVLAERLAREQSVMAQRMAKQVEGLHAQRARIESQALQSAARVQEQALRLQERLRSPVVWAQDSESGWLGVQVSEVTAEKMKELKLAAERGVLVTDVEMDSPAAKAGLKVNDVITELNGQRVEGTVQFRRLIRETPSGRSVQLTVWRDGKAQQMSAQLGDWSDRWRRDFSFSSDWFSLGEGPRVFTFSSSPAPRLGISGDDLSGQLGNYFGAPNGEGVLVREVTSGGAAEKAGMKAGDVIIRLDGKRVRNLSDMRSLLREKRERKTVAVVVLRKGAETTLNVEVEQPQRERRTISRRITL
jgi:C-terminal processing protease CtpA/Prc